jgi:hypothetical protein
MLFEYGRRLASYASILRSSSFLKATWLFVVACLAAFTTGRAEPLVPLREKQDDPPVPRGESPSSPRRIVSTAFGISYQINVNVSGSNIVGDAANEPSFCIDPTNPNRMAVGWRQFDTTNSNFRQAGFAYSTNGGVDWKFGGTLETNVFRSDPVLASDADGRFYYLSLKNSPGFECDLWRSTNGGAGWQRVGQALGGDKEWMTIDTTTGPGRGTIYQCWSIVQNTFSNRIFSLTRNGGLTWSNPIAIPQTPFWSTLDVGPSGQLCLLGWNGSTFWFNRSLNAADDRVPFVFDLTVPVDLGGELVFGAGIGPNPGGLMGQVSIAADRSTNATRGNLYALCSIGTVENLVDVMFSRSTDGGTNWSAPMRLNTDADYLNAWHWFGTLSVAPNGRIDVCWFDTRGDTNDPFSATAIFSELYYCYSLDGGVSWAPNHAISPPFNSLIGFPQQNKIGDYLGLVSLDDAACIVYPATFNGEEDLYFIRVDLPITVTISKLDNAVQLSWDAVVGKTYCVQWKDSLTVPWPVGTNQTCLPATNSLMTITEPVPAGDAQRYYRVVKQP